MMCGCSVGNEKGPVMGPLNGRYLSNSREVWLVFSIPVVVLPTMNCLIRE